MYLGVTLNPGVTGLELFAFKILKIIVEMDICFKLIYFNKTINNMIYDDLIMLKKQ